jgi:dTDP-4-amino-4,6-dideoxygalactose transaminase
MIASERRRKANLYTTLLAETDIIPIGMHKDSVPWRYCFRIVGISKVRQEALSSELRAVGVHVSNWYLPTHWMVAPTYLATGELRGTEQLASEIFQLWLDDSTDDAQIHANAMAIRKLLDR